MDRKLFPLATISSALLLLAGCASYHANSLNILSPEMVTQASPSKTHDVRIVAKAFDKVDCKRYLDRDVIRKGYQPVQLYIQNNSDKSYVFSLNRLSLSYASPEDVARTVHTSTMGRVLGYGIPGIIIAWPLVIPAVVDGIKSSEANEALDRDFYTKTAKEDQIIAPHSHFNKIVFVDAYEYQSNFTLTLIDQDSKKEEIFNIVAS
jgi:hypothetical protein